jgi:centrosomal protein CEP104
MLAERAWCVQFFGTYAASCFFGKRFQLREAALRAMCTPEAIAALADAGRAGDAVAAALMRYVGESGYGVQDAIAQVFFATAEVIRLVVVGGIGGAAFTSSLQNAVVATVPDLLLKAGDGNQRVRETAAALLMQIALSPCGPERIVAALLHDPQKDSKRPLNFRVQAARLGLASQLLAKVGTSGRARSGGFTPENIVRNLCLPQLAHANGEVREAAINLIAALYGAAGANARALDALLAEIKPAQRALIDERIAANGGGGAGLTSARSEHDAELDSTSLSVQRAPAPARGGGGGGARAAAAAAPSGPASARSGAAPTRSAATAPAAAAAAAMAASAPAAASAPRQTAAQAAAAEAERQAKTCQFCGRYDARFTDETLDAHYMRSCPMLCPCPLCGQVSEISLLQEHLVSECDRASLVRQCPSCKEALRAQDLATHVAAKRCIPANPASYSVCPLCHEKLQPGDAGWTRHLCQAPGCPNNPRPYDGGDPDGDFL